MNVLCITDQISTSSHHSAIGGIFGVYLRRECAVVLVSFSRDARTSSLQGSDIVIPYSKKGRTLEEIAGLVDLATFDVVIVRNFIAVLWQALRKRSRYGFRVGFWNSFPHSFRRYFQARLERKAVLRKAVEYQVRSVLENRLVQNCDFLIAMSPEFKSIYYPASVVPFLALPMGVDFAHLPRHAQPKSGCFRAIYTGTIDGLRQVDVILKALCGLQEDFILDIYSSSRNEAVDAIKTFGDPRVRLHGPLPRTALFEVITGYDLGIGVIPEHKLYEVSSPTKTLEYYALGVPALVSHLPEYTKLFDSTTAFFCHFNVDEIRDAFQRAVRTPRSELAAMGCRGKTVIQEKRNYESLSQDLYRFLNRENVS
jgi:glycosyltransferase involved in cell wall biosynthesis